MRSSVSNTALAARYSIRALTHNIPRYLDQIKADQASPKHLRQYNKTKAAEDLPAWASGTASNAPAGSRQSLRSCTIGRGSHTRDGKETLLGVASNSATASYA